MAARYYTHFVTSAEPAHSSEWSGVIELTHPLGERLGGGPRRLLIQFVEDRPGHDRRYAIDPSKIETELGWRPRESFESGLAGTVDWYLANEWWWRPIREQKYGGGRLGVAG